MDVNDMEFINLVYDLMIGAIDPEKHPAGELEKIKDLFQSGSRCDRLYEQAYQAKCRLFDRLHSDEDPDVTCIFENLMSIAEEFSKNMFYYGAYFAQNPEDAGEAP